MSQEFILPNGKKFTVKRWEDIYAKAASEFYGVQYILVTREQRAVMKDWLFGQIYGGVGRLRI